MTNIIKMSDNENSNNNKINVTQENTQGQIAQNLDNKEHKELGAKIAEGLREYFGENYEITQKTMHAGNGVFERISFSRKRVRPNDKRMPDPQVMITLFKNEKGETQARIKLTPFSNSKSNFFLETYNPENIAELYKDFSSFSQTEDVTKDSPFRKNDLNKKGEEMSKDITKKN